MGWIYRHWFSWISTPRQKLRGERELKGQPKEGTKTQVLILFLLSDAIAHHSFWSWLAKVSLQVIFKAALWFLSQKQGKEGQECQGKSSHIYIYIYIYIYSESFRNGIYRVLKSIDREGWFMEIYLQFPVFGFSHNGGFDLRFPISIHIFY